MAHIKTTVHLSHGMTKAELMREIDGIPDTAVITAGVTVGDRPWESDDHRLEFQWTGDLKDSRPHSRACGISPHPHGPSCSSDCPTCHSLPAPGVLPRSMDC